MLVQPGTLISAGCHAGKDPIFGLQNLNHYSDPSLSGLIFHSGADLKEILPIKGAQKMEQPDPAYAMQYVPEAFNGLGGYSFPETNRFMMYDADPVPFQVERTIGIVVSTPGPFNNDQIFGLSKFSAFNTHWRVSTSTVTGGRITSGRQEVELGEWPVLASGVIGTDYIIIVRQVSLDVHEFYLNSYENPIIINPQDDYWVSNRVRLCLGRPFSTRSEAGVIIGPVFDCMSVISPQKIKEIVLFWSVRAGISIA